MPTTATGRLSSAASVSSNCVSCERVFRILRRSRAQTARVARPSSKFSWDFFLEQLSRAAGAARTQTFVAVRSLNWEPPSSIAWSNRAVNMALQVAKETKLQVRSLQEDSDDPIVSTERVAKPVSYVPIPDIRGGVIALGKFDALHAGHRALAEQAAKMGAPVLLSFSGMAEVLGWEPRLPVAAFYDRKSIMTIWAKHCGGVVPRECAVEFIKVRSLSPRDFVQKLSTDLCVKGVVAGANYRFGYKAAGDASDLVHLCSEYGLESFIVDPVMDKDEAVSSMNGELAGYSREKGQISSTRVRKALAMGNMERVTSLLGRRHRVIFNLDNCSKESKKLLVPIKNAMNQYPGEGLYECTLIGTGEHLFASSGQDPGDDSSNDFVGNAQVRIGSDSAEIIFVDSDTGLMPQRRLLAVEFSYG